jgi:hypothetical protein
MVCMPEGITLRNGCRDWMVCLRGLMQRTPSRIGLRLLHLTIAKEEDKLKHVLRLPARVCFRSAVW